MQAPKVDPSDMICKYKFLVQSTVVPAGTTDDEITSSMFMRDDSRKVQKVKLRVVLLGPPISPIFSPINAILKQDPLHEPSRLNKCGRSMQNNQVAEDVVKTKVSDSGVVKPDKDLKNKITKEVKDLAEYIGYESMKELNDSLKDVIYKTVKGSEDPNENGDSKILDNLQDEGDLTNKGGFKTLDPVMGEEDPKKNRDYGNNEKGQANSDVKVAIMNSHHITMKEIYERKLVKDVEEIKSKLNLLESKLKEAEVTISKLTEERKWTGQQKENLRQELALLRSKRGDRKFQVEFPLLFVCMVALVGIVLGYTLCR